MKRRTKDEKRALKLEAARLAKTHLSAEDWSQETAKACERLANRYLGHTKGCRSSDLRSAPKICELPSVDLLDHISVPTIFIRP